MGVISPPRKQNFVLWGKKKLYFFYVYSIITYSVQKQIINIHVVKYAMRMIGGKILLRGMRKSLRTLFYSNKQKELIPLCIFESVLAIGGCLRICECNMQT